MAEAEETPSLFLSTLAQPLLRYTSSQQSEAKKFKHLSNYMLQYSCSECFPITINVVHTDCPLFWLYTILFYLF